MQFAEATNVLRIFFGGLFVVTVIVPIMLGSLYGELASRKRLKTRINLACLGIGIISIIALYKLNN